MAISISAVTRAGDAPPTVQVNVAGIPAGSATMTITRSVEGQTNTVRGADGLLVVGAVGGVLDYEAPFGTSIVYSVIARNSGGAVTGQAQSAGVSLDVDVMWISDPLAPGISAPCRGVKSPESFASMTYEVSAAVSPIDGAELPIALTGTRRAASSVPLTIIAKDAAEAGPIRTVLRYAQPFQLRLPARWQVPLPKMSYCFADSITDNLFGGGTPGRTHLTTTFSLVAPPAASIVVPARTYATVLTEAPTYGDLPGLYPTYLAVLRG